MKVQSKNKKIQYVVVCVLLVCIEVMIALYVHDNFIRPYLGDVLVVAVIYFFIRVFISEKCRLLPLYVFLFAAGVEILQYFELVRMLGLEHNAFFRTVIGSVFDIKDIVCYAFGCGVLAFYEWLKYKKETKNKE